MTDRELLELAAKAYANPLITPSFPEFTRWIGRNEDMGCDAFAKWNPLLDDGDALRLAVKLGLFIDAYPPATTVGNVVDKNSLACKTRMEDHNGDPDAATRRAITRAAAEVGKGMLSHDEFVRMFPGRFESQ